MTRDERQDVSLQKWVRTGSLGTIEAFTGFGKTRIATNAIKLLRRNDATRSVVIVVPTIPLKQQWEEALDSLGLSQNTEVYVINTLIKKPPFDCSLVVLDEIHRYAAETFSKVFGVTKYSFVLGLTATLKRLDKKHDTLEKYAPVRDKVTMIEGKRNGWMAPFTEYNLGIELDDESAEEYRNYRIEFGKYFDKFQNDFDLMRRCSFSINPYYAGGFPQAPMVVRYARRLGWRGNNNELAMSIHRANQNAPRGQKQDIWGNDSHPYAPQKLFVYAINGMRMNRKIVDFCYNHPSKIAVAEQLLRTFEDKKALTFCQTTKSADDLATRMGRAALVYHSNMEPYTANRQQVKPYKTRNGAEKWIEKNPEWRLRELANGTFSVYRYREVKISASKAREEALEKLQANGQVRVVCTAKALDQGFDFPGCQLGIIYARTSSPTQQVQRTGRIIRKHFFDDGSEKKSTVINIYLKDTKDYQWLNKAQRNSAGVRWVDSVEEIVESESLRLEV